MTNELPDGELETLWDDGEFVLSRVSHAADRAPTLAVCPAALHPNAASLVFESSAIPARIEMTA